MTETFSILCGSIVVWWLFVEQCCGGDDVLGYLIKGMGKTDRRVRVFIQASAKL
jgi:hypothetical protein